MSRLLLLLFLLPMNILAQQFHEGIMAKLGNDAPLFPFGVASGDPRPDRVLLWTKLFPGKTESALTVEWAIAEDTLMASVVAGGKVTTDSSSAFTVMVDASGLKAGTTYFFHFITGNDTSATGRTRTAPKDPNALRFAVASCAHIQYGNYNGYALIAQRNDLDAVIHLGDYIYEGGARAEALHPHIPPYEIISLSDYRSRYAQYRLNSDLMEMHRLHPIIAIWDDHEFANNCHRDGAERHTAAKGSWEKRKSNARRAYFEWIPVMTASDSTIIRDFNFGGLADLFMLDGRLHRDPMVDSYDDPARYDTSRTKLGRDQTERLTRWLKDSKAKCKVLGNNVMMSPIDFGKFAKGRRWNMDQWDGYMGNRNRIFDAIEKHEVENVVVITGDIHTAWASELSRDPHDRNVYDRKTGKGVFGAEFVAQSISSSNLDEIQGKLVGKIAASYSKARKRNPQLRYVNLIDHGYMLLDLNSENAKATWVFTQTLKKPTLRTRRPVAWQLTSGDNSLQRTRP